MARKADDAFSSVFLILLFVGGVMFVNAWIKNELPPWLMQLIASFFHASPTGNH